MKHTPTPWTYRGTMNGTTLYVVADLPEPALSLAMNGGPGYIAKLTAPNAGSIEASDPSFVSANADFIIRACNTHDDMVAALEKLVLMETTQGVTDDDMEIAIERACATLAKAKGE